MNPLIDPFMCVGLNSPAAKILAFLVTSPGPHSVLDITKNTNLPQSAICLNIKSLSSCIAVESVPVAKPGKGRPYHTYALKSKEAAKELLRGLASATISKTEALATIEAM